MGGDSTDPLALPSTAHGAFAAPQTVATKQQRVKDSRGHAQAFSAPVDILNMKRFSLGETEMLMVMDMSTGKIIADEFGEFEDEVLNAEWTPPARMEPHIALQQVHPTPLEKFELDAEAFLCMMYRAQA